ncbi:DUF6509 family protein [Paenibacillus pinistramenti]|uniref:DUF6509 family protein n=1 Tax=Paenibacillus pinistramenti TaxID=1768003 RepID=UPI001109AE91|nr:DUF6509 family protein [Paenibacillus pinistramenti]
MLNIADYSAEYVKDPFGILSGRRYEFRINLDIPEDDDLYTVNGVYARVIVKEEQGTVSMVTYDLLERGTDKILEFDLEEEEEAELEAFCKEHLPEEE